MDRAHSSSLSYGPALMSIFTAHCSVLPVLFIWRFIFATPTPRPLAATRNKFNGSAPVEVTAHQPTNSPAHCHHGFSTEKPATQFFISHVATLSASCAFFTRGMSKVPHQLWLARHNINCACQKIYFFQIPGDGPPPRT